MQPATETTAPPHPAVTECHVMLPRPDEDPRVLCYCSFVLFGMVKVHDCKLIDCGGRPHLAMPRRELKSSHCPWCGFKRVRVRDRHCSGCGVRVAVPPASAARDAMCDVVNPINCDAREALVSAAVAAYRAALAAAAGPDGGHA